MRTSWAAAELWTPCSTTHSGGVALTPAAPPTVGGMALTPLRATRCGGRGREPPPTHAGCPERFPASKEAGARPCGIQRTVQSLAGREYALSPQHRLRAGRHSRRAAEALPSLDFSICHSVVGLIVCLPTGQITHGVTWRGAQGDTVPPKATLRAEASRTSASPSSGGCLASGWEHLLWSQTWFMYQLCCSTARSS